MDLNTFFSRYRPYLAIVAAVVALVAFMPGDGDDNEVATGGAVVTAPGVGGVPGAPADNTGGGDQLAAPDAAVPGGAGTPAVGPDATSGGGAAPAPGAATGSASGGTATPGSGGGSAAPPTTEAVQAAPSALDNPNCDPATGRIKVPTVFAPPCVPVFTGDNGGETYRGVNEDTIRVVYFQAEADPAVQAALTAAGANNTNDEQEATMRAYVDYFNHHYELYGRQVELIVRKGSGDSDDDAVARADALAVISEDKPFAVFGSPASNVFPEELAASGVLCICTTSQPQEFYERLAPYVGYTTLMASTQGYIHRAEYVGKRLAGRLAVHAGTSDGLPLSTNERKFGLLWYETPDNAYAAGVEFFEKHLREVYGVELAESLAFPSDYGQVAERAQALIQKLKSSGVTSVIFSGDPISPAIFTKEATKQAYFPEWIITGSALTDTTIFARTFDQQQWNKAFGISFLTARAPEENGSAYRTHFWHHGTTAVANNQYGVIYPTPFTFFTGVHLAGPNLTVQTWQQGLFSYPVTGQGRVTAATSSYGNHGFWPFVDYTNLDDVTEIWWDPTAPGEDEVGNQGVGMYRYVDGGRRYMPGQHPTTDPNVFTTENAPTIYTEVPPGEEHPDYEHQPH